MAINKGYTVFDHTNLIVLIWMLSPAKAHTHTHNKMISNNDDDKITKRIREDLNKKRSWFSLYVFS